MVTELQRRNEASGDEEEGEGDADEGDEGRGQGGDESEEEDKNETVAVEEFPQACTSFLPHPNLIVNRGGVVPPEGEVLNAIVLNPSTTALPAIVWNRLTES